jgi:acyl dehydratase
MIQVSGLAELKTLEGQTLGPSPWRTITQPMIDAFADATDDHQWIHCDPERAAKESPFRKTIAHGFLTLSLFQAMQDGIWTISGVSRGVNYGADKLRFIAPVIVDSNIRMKQHIQSVEPIPGGVRLTMESTVEIEGVDKPALVITSIGLLYA